MTESPHPLRNLTRILADIVARLEREQQAEQPPANKEGRAA
jgi:hypothetical protein